MELHKKDQSLLLIFVMVTLCFFITSCDKNKSESIIKDMQIINNEDTEDDMDSNALESGFDINSAEYKEKDISEEIINKLVNNYFNYEWIDETYKYIELDDKTLNPCGFMVYMDMNNNVPYIKITAYTNKTETTYFDKVILNIVDENTGTFFFNDTIYGNSGNGTIRFEDNVITLSLEYKEDDNTFSFWNGEKKFTKVNYDSKIEKYSPEKHLIISATGNSLESFVPRNWKIIGSDKGDLNEDKISDIVAVIENIINKNEKKVLFVVFGNNQNSYDLSIISDAVIPVLEVNNELVDTTSLLSIDNGSILMNLSDDGKSYIKSKKLRFRFQNMDWYLIGATIANYNVDTFEEVIEDYNLLTGKMKKTIKIENEKSNVKMLNVGKKELVKLTEFDYYTYEPE